jgi:hypothetical protein
MLDFLVCSLLLFVIGTGGSQTQFATSAPQSVHEAFAPAAIQAQQEEWNREYEQQALLSQLQTETTEKQQLQARLATREETLQRVAQEKAQTEQTLTNVETRLAGVIAERERLEKEGEVAKERVAQLQTEQSKLQQQAAQLGQTVASQQSTISTLGQEVRASQARMESQLSEVTGGQQAMQQNVAALAENVKELQAQLSPEERARLMDALGSLAKGQQDIQSRLDGLGTGGGGTNQFGESLSNIEAGQEALRQQTAKLGEQIESIKARGPGPYKAVRAARVELEVAITRRDQNQNVSHFRALAYPTVINVDGRPFIVANYRTLGLAWWGLSGGEITDIKVTVGMLPTATEVCALRADPHVVAIPLQSEPMGMELSGPEAVLQTDQRKLNIFKSTAAGLSFEVDVAADLSDPRYLVVRRSLRGVAAWLENPAYRPDTGDYMVTADGKLVGIMVSRERCLILSKETLLDCAATLPLADPGEFQRAAAQYPRVR